MKSLNESSTELCKDTDRLMVFNQTHLTITGQPPTNTFYSFYNTHQLPSVYHNWLGHNAQKKFRKHNSAPYTSIKIKSLIDRDGATCRNNNQFECPTILNDPWDEQTDKRTDGRTDATECIITPASRSIIILRHKSWFLRTAWAFTSLKLQDTVCPETDMIKTTQHIK